MKIVRHMAGGEAQFAVLKDGELSEIPGVSNLEGLVLRLRDGEVELLPQRDQYDERRVRAPVGRATRNIFAVGMNYAAHREESGDQVANRNDTPVFFTKATTTINDPFGIVPLHDGVTKELDWEGELAVIIGVGGTDIPEKRAMSHVFGYMVANDLSARDLQRSTGGQWFRGKSLDGTCPLGPWIVTADEMPDPYDCQLSTAVNATERQRAPVADMEFGIDELISQLSRGLTLVPGDIILTGTPDGVGASRRPPEFLEEGDVVEVTISGIGRIRNEVRDVNDQRPT